MPRTKKPIETTQTLEEKEESFLVVDTSPSIKQAVEKPFSAEEQTTKMLEQAMKDYNVVDKMYSAYLNEKATDEKPTTDILNELAICPQDNLQKTLRIINIIAKFVNIDDVIGKTVEAIQTNINTEHRFSYPIIEGRNKTKSLERDKLTIKNLNDEIKIKRVIREYIPRTFQEGTVILYLRSDESGWVVDCYPLGVAQIAPYSKGGEPVVLIDMTELKNRLQKAGLKTRSGKNMYFRTIEEEIRENYPPEVYEALLKKDPYAELNIKYTGVLRVGNRGKKYGLSSIFRALNSAVILQGFYKSDEVNSKARSKKVLAQYLKKELLGPMGEKNPLTQQAFSHSEMLKSYRQPGNIIYTAPAYVEKIEYVEPKSDMIDTKTVAYHLNREMSTLGINFLSMEGANQSVSTATISLEQLMKTINSISEQLEEVLEKWYRQILIDENGDPEHAPSIKILDSEALEFSLKKELATFMYSTLNLSLRTALETLGYDVEEERTRREQENTDGYASIFIPRATSNTTSSDSTDKNGRPPAETKTDKTQYDEKYNEVRT